ncbi:MAG TPA: hypothetical protein VF042_14250 [Gemmatimonadaceae bacterium]
MRAPSAPRPTAAEAAGDSVLGRLFADAPAPSFRIAEYASGSTVLVDSVADVDGARSLRLIRAATELPNGRRILFRESWRAGAAGVLEDFQRDAENGSLETWWTTGVRAVEGKLFPLAVGNKLRLVCEIHNRSSASDYPTETNTFVFTVTDTTSAYRTGSLQVPGPVFVIQREAPGDTALDPLTIHYSPELGTAVLIRRPEYEERLRSWRK